MEGGARVASGTRPVCHPPCSTLGLCEGGEGSRFSYILEVLGGEEGVGGGAPVFRCSAVMALEAAVHCPGELKGCPPLA